MALRDAARRRRSISLTPLIDIIFLLLLFFMLSSTFTRFAELPLQNAGAGGPLQGAAPLFLRLTPEDLTLNGVALGLDTVAQALAQAQDGTDETVLLITLAGDVTSQRLVDLLVVLRTVPGLTVSVLG